MVSNSNRKLSEAEERICWLQDCQLNVYKPNPRQYIASISQVRSRASIASISKVMLVKLIQMSSRNLLQQLAQASYLYGEMNEGCAEKARGSYM